MAGATVGVLVLANLGDAEQLRVDGVPVGRTLRPAHSQPGSAGSCIARLARRAGLGLGRTGSVAHHGSGEIFLAFSTAGRQPREAMGRRDESFADLELDPLFAATVDATEEAVLNALWAAPDVSGRDGRVVPGLPHDAVFALLREQGRLSC